MANPLRELQAAARCRAPEIHDHGGGTADVFTPRWMAEEIAERVPACDIHLDEGAGHAFHWERIDDFNSRVAGWFQSR